MHLLKESEAAEYLNVSMSYLAQARMNGAMENRPAPPFRRIGARMVRYDRDELDKWIKSGSVANDSVNTKGEQQHD